MRIVVVIGLAFILVIAFVIWLVRTRGSYYYFRPDGYTVITSGSKSAVHHTSIGGLRTSTKNLLWSGSFDMLWVSTRDDEYTGLTVTMESGTPILTVDFKTNSERLKRESFKKAMAARGFTGSEETDGYNGGLAPEFRVTAIDYRLAREENQVLQAVQVALGALHGDPKDGYYVKGTKLATPGPSGGGFEFVPDVDPLNELR